MPEPEQSPDIPCQPAAQDGSILAENPASVTLEHIMVVTGEMEHLNELVLLHLECSGGFSGTEAYFATVRPILDSLEAEIRAQYKPGMSKTAMKAIIASWIETGICDLQ